MRGVPVIWRLRVPLYGEADAGRLWNRTFVRFLTGPIDGGGGGWSQSGYDPCYFFKILHDNARIDMALYVDDGYVIDSGSPLADAELTRLHDRFTIAINTQSSSWASISLSARRNFSRAILHSFWYPSIASMRQRGG